MSFLIAGGLGMLFYQVDKSMKNDAEALRKNAKAATRMADAESKLAYCRQNMTEAIITNAKRKNGILSCHIKMFLEQCEIMKKTVYFKQGKGIEELEKIAEIQRVYDNYIQIPAVSSGMVMTDSQLLVTFALRGISGMIVKESEMNLKTASKNLSKANAFSAQVDSVCIAINAVTDHVKIVTELLEKSGMLYMKSIKNITEILKENGCNVEKFSDDDIDAINLSFALTKLLYRIINTPLVDEDGEIEKESIKVISEGQQLLNSIQS